MRSVERRIPTWRIYSEEDARKGLDYAEEAYEIAKNTLEKNTLLRAPFIFRFLLSDIVALIVYSVVLLVLAAKLPRRGTE